MDFALQPRGFSYLPRRSGSITELAFFGKAAILIPYPYAGAHQLRMPLAKKKRGGAGFEEKELEGPKLAELILKLMIQLMSAQLEKRVADFAHPEASDRLAELVLNPDFVIGFEKNGLNP